MNEVITGDSLEVLDTLEENSIHSCVTDPPYGLAFMGRDWDDFEPREYQEWCEEWATKVKRLLKPGGHLLAFSGNRTHHRLFSGVEDAGFEIRDTITWHYGSGFPKALDVGKAIDKASGAERETVGTKVHKATNGEDYGEYSTGKQPITAPATEAAKQWDGWKTALKPATEYVVVARKPFDSTVAENVQAHGTGALNIGETRIETDGRPNRNIDPNAGADTLYDGGTKGTSGMAEGTTTEGRYPANVIFDETQADALDQEIGELDAGAHPQNQSDDRSWRFSGLGENNQSERAETDIGGPSRYFYTSKATKAERTLDGKIDNAHPTVKPIDLMEWLVKLVTAEGQTVLDPFTGSGTTLKAAKNLNRDFIGIEKQEKWADVARVRAGLTPKDPSNVREDKNQSGLGNYTG